MADIDEAVDRVMGGPAKKSRKYTEKERRLVAYHEAGHALIGLTLEDANNVQKVTIVPRGQAGGYNLMTPKAETSFQTKSQLKATISGYMGGRVAEKVFFGDVSSGAHNDIEQATRIARMMVTELGMSEMCIRDRSYLVWYFKSDAWYRYIYDNGSQGVRYDSCLLYTSCLLIDYFRH